jgi:DNA-binding protein HU-beta
MTKAELVDKVVARVSKKVEISKKAAGDIIDVVFDEVANAVKKDRRFSYPGFGTFNVKARKARKGRNPQTGATIKIAARKVPKFTPGSELKKAVR